MFTHDGVHSAVTRINLNLRWQKRVHHETQTKAPFTSQLSITRVFPKRRSHSSILPSNGWHWMTSAFLSVYNEAGSWRLLWKDNEGSCLISLLQITWDDVRWSVLYQHFMDSGESPFPIKWEEDSAGLDSALKDSVLMRWTVGNWGILSQLV